MAKLSYCQVLVFCALLANAGAQRPNVLLIAIDDLNDWVGCLGGHPQAVTPNIDRLAGRGTLFTNAHCQAPICNPSRTSLMLGLRPSTTGVYTNSPKHWTVPALKDKVTLARHFAAHGYHTLTAGKIYHGSGLPDGDFDVDALPAEGVALPPSRDGDRDDLPAAAIELTENPTPPPHEWFLEGDRWRLALQAFTASVRFTDAQLGRVLDALDAGPHRDNTVVVLYSDHGFHLGEKQRWAKQSLWERSTRVPMVISAPGKPAGQRRAEPVELLSIYPTLIELCGIGRRGALEGASLLPLLDRGDVDWPHVAITTYRRGNHAVRDRRYRYIRYADGSEELYDHRVDPNEWSNLAGEAGGEAVVARMRKYLPEADAEAAEAGRGQGRRPLRER